MRRFLLGVATGVALVLLAGAALVWSARPDAPRFAASVSPSPSPSASSAPKDTTRLATVDLSSNDVLTAGGRFTDVEATAGDVVLSPTGLTVGTLSLQVTLPWATAATQVGEGVQLYAAGPGRAGLSRTVEVLGQQIPVKATGTVRAQDGLLVIEPETIDLEGPDWLDTAASALARTLVTIRQPVQGVPEGMTLQQVDVVDSGFRARLTGTGITLTQ